MFPEDERPTFVNRLSIELKLTIDGSELTVPAGDIKALSFDIGMGGFTATAQFWVSRTSLTETDDLIEKFSSRSSIGVQATIDRSFDDPGEAVTPMVLVGTVIERSVLERSYPNISGNPTMRRFYAIRFVDKAAALWSQHRPATIKVDTTLKEVVEAQLPTGISISSVWPAYEAKLPMCAFALGHATFYDWLHWWLDTHNGFLRYNIGTNAYTVVDAKPGEGTPVELSREDSGELRWMLPTPPRAVVQVLNASTEVTTPTSKGTNPDALTGLTTDILIRSPLGNSGADRLTLEQARLKGPAPELHGAFTRYPTVGLAPGMLISFDDEWSNEALLKTPTWRCARLHLEASAQAPEPTQNEGDASNTYEMVYRFELETSDDPVWRRRPYVRPDFPFHVEGKVVSEQGEEAEGTYQAYQEDTTMLSVYKVNIPLFDVVITVPYEQQSMPGHFYFPAYKDERVLVAVGSTTATLAQFLDWRPGAKLPQETQGNQLLLGKRDTDETSLNHVYEEGNPVLRIERTHGQDRQVVTIEEGVIRLETREDDA